MSSPAGQNTPDDVPSLRLPTQELTQTVQAAAMLVSALRSRRESLGARAWHPHEDAAREHDTAESPPVTQPSGQDHAHRWAHAAAGAWGSENLAAQPSTWSQPDPREQDLQALWTTASQLEQRGHTPADVLAGMSAPETSSELSAQLHEAIQTWPSWRDSSGEQSRVWHEPNGTGRVVVTRWEAGTETSGPSLTRVCARDAEVADQALHTLREGSDEQRQQLLQAAQVGTRSRDRARGPREQVVSAEQVHASIAAVTGENTASAVRGCAAWPALHQRINARVAAGDDLAEVVGVLEGLDLREARKPAAVASSRIQPVEDREAAATAEALSPRHGWDHASATMLHGQHGSAVDASLTQRGLRRTAKHEEEGARWSGISELARRAAYAATERGVIAADWLARDLGVEYRSAVSLVSALQQDGVVGPAEGQQHPALVRRGDVDTYLGVAETEPTRRWRTELTQAAEHAGQHGSVGTSELQRGLDVTYPRATCLLDGLSAAGVVADEAGDWRTGLVSSPEQARGQLGQPAAGVSPAASPTPDPELLARAGELVTREQWGSTRMLQRRLQLDPDEAVTLMNGLETHAIVGPADEHGRARAVQASPAEAADRLGHPTQAASGSGPTPAVQPSTAPSGPAVSQTQQHRQEGPRPR